jgi:hypothetical protein
MTPIVQGSNSLADLAARINAEHAAAEAVIASWLDHAITAGELLIEAKGMVPHGQWIDWVRDHCRRVSVRMVQIYMQLVRYKALLESAKANSISHMSIDEAIRIVREAEKRRYIDQICERSRGVGRDVVQLSHGVLLQERDDDRYNQFVGREERSRTINLDHDATSQIEALARQRTELLERAERLEQEAKELKEQAAALQKQISKKLRSAFVQQQPELIDAGTDPTHR